jgi:DNA polymerase III alpha subunit
MSARSQSLTPKDWSVKAPEYLYEAEILGVPVKAPDVNKSELEFKIKHQSIYFGLSAIRDVGATAAKSIIKARANTPFKSVGNFLQRVDTRKVTTKVFKALVLAGAFDELGYSRTQLFESTQQIYDYLKDQIAYEERKREIEVREAERKEIQVILDRKNELKRIKRLKRERDLTIEEEQWLEEHNSVRQKISLKEKPLPQPPNLSRSRTISLTPDDLILQKRYVGAYIGRHPAPILFPGTQSLSTLAKGEYATVCGEVVSMKKIKDRRGNPMCFMTIGDGRGQAEIIVFSSLYRKLDLETEESLIPSTGDIIRLEGRCDADAPSAKIIANRMTTYRSKNGL